MLHYRDFETLIIEDDPVQNMHWKHILPSVPLAHRLRFIKTYKKGFDIPASFDMVMTSQTINEKEYDIFLDKMVEERDAEKEVKSKSPA